MIDTINYVDISSEVLFQDSTIKISNSGSVSGRSFQLTKDPKELFYNITTSNLESNNLQGFAKILTAAKSVISHAFRHLFGEGADFEVNYVHVGPRVPVIY